MNVILKHLKATVSLNSLANKISNSVLLLAVACISLFYSNSIFGQTTYSNSGTFYYTVPAGVTKLKVECWGAGGAGGSNTVWDYPSGGGGGGAYSSSIISVIPGNVYTVTVGKGGVFTLSDGDDGTDTWFVTPTTIMAKGGLGGVGGSATNGGEGGSSSSSIGTIKFSGGNGDDRTISDITGGQGGSSAGIYANGNTGIAPLGGGDGGDGGLKEGNGYDGMSPGGGGGGAGDNWGGNLSGGNGADGKVIITIPSQVTLSSPNQIVASNVYQGTASHPVFSFQTEVATSNATINTLTFTTSGSYIASDIDNFKLLYSTTNDILTASQIGSDITTTLGSGSHTFTGLNQATANGSTGYFWITTNINANATIGAGILVEAITLSDSNYDLAEVSGSTSNGGTQTVLGMPSIALSSDNPAVPSSSINQGTSNNIIYRFVNTVSVASANLNSVSFTTTGTCTNFDVTRFRLWHSTTDNFSTASQIGSDIISSTGAGSHTFTGLSLTTTAGSTNYFWITANIASFPTNGRTVRVSAITTSNLTYDIGIKSGSAFAGGTKTISVANGILLTSNFPAVSATSIPQDTQNKAVYKFSTIITGVNVRLKSVRFQTTGSYVASDVSNFKLWYNTVNSLVTATQISTITSSLGTGTHTFSGLNQSTNSGLVGYFWITADISATATPANTLKVEAITTADLTYISGSKFGVAYYGGIQTIQLIVDTDGDGVANLYDYDDDNDGIPDISENLPCNTSLEELFPNSGFEDGNVGFSSGYGYATGYNSLYPEGLYSVQSDASSVHDHFANCTGHGNMMVVNGSSNANLIVWSSGSISVTPNTDYTLRVQIASVTSSNPAQLIFNVNGENIGTQFNATSTNCQWTNAETIWNSGNSTTATFEIVNLNLIAGGNDFAIDNVSCTYRSTCDTDGDLIPDQLDLDSDNDGIYDIVEAGGSAVHAGDGTISGFVDADGDGLSDNVDNIDSGKGAGEVMSGTPLTNADIDGDGFTNSVDLDSDGDLCFDVIEAGYNDGDDDGILGVSAVIVNDKGVVTGQGGYTTPTDADGNVVFDFMQQVPVINTQPANSSICLGVTSTTSFTIGASNVGGTYQWQVSTNNGVTWNNISGETSSTLNLTGINATFDLNQYRVQLSHPAYVCSPLTSDAAVLRAFASVPPQPSLITGEDVVCQNVGSLSYSVTLEPQATSYTWSLPTGWSIDSGTGTNSIVASSSTTSGDITVNSNNTCGSSLSRTLAVTIDNPTPTFTAPAATQVCQSAEITYTTQSGKYNYVWDITTGSLGADYIIVSGGSSTDPSITIKWQTSGDQTVTVNYSSGGCQGAVAAVKTITVIENAIISTQPVNPSPMCAGADVATISIGTIGSVTGYQWQVSIDGGSNWNDISDVAPYSNVTTNTMTITNPAASLNNYQYRCRVTGACGTIYSNSATLTVNATQISTQSTDGQTQFLNGSFSSITVSTIGSGLTYQWFSNTSASTTGGTSLGAANGAQTDSYTPQATVTGILYYYCEISGTCGSVTSAISGAFEVLPEFTITEDNTQHCGNYGDSFTTQSVAGYNFLWSFICPTCPVFTITDETTNKVTVVSWPNPTDPLTNDVTVKLVVTHIASGTSIEITKDITVSRTSETGEQYHVINNFSN
ncbi:MAG: hypothetical protein JXA53_08240 [Bacteroidales bacterium]|nr:hypothetical protein [Bacteroidales bacterium]